ncbi:MAG: cysteine hydrolase [Clostridium celatum]|nr:cysteine hydrolase [Clostridium celatum]MDU4980726.1 cysteine hydrolase [Clostridium celatum]
MNPALVIIDMQNWFFRSEDRREKLSELIESINQLIEVATTKNITIFQVLTIHKADKSTWNIVMKKHNFSALIEGSEEAKLLPEIKFDSSQEIIVKTRQSTFIRTNFEEKLKEKNIDTLILSGVFTHGCVGRTAVDAYERDFNIILAKDASFSHMKNQEKSMLEVIKEEQEQLVLSNKEIIEYLNTNIL